MNTGILNVLPVQAALVPQILLELLLDVAHHRLPAGGWGEGVQSEKSGRGKEGTRPARTMGVGTSVLGSNQRHQERSAGCSQMSGRTGTLGHVAPRSSPHLLGRARAEQTSPGTEHSSSQRSHIRQLGPRSFPCSSPV